MKTILFVCTANICRSPMAAAIMRRHIADAGLDGEVLVQSAGVYAEPGHKASRDATTVLHERGLDLSEHRSQSLTSELVAQADIILVMEESHRRSVFYLASQHLAKVFLLSEMAGRHDDIGDPFGGPYEGYQRTADSLETLVAAGLPKILKRIGVKPPAGKATDKNK